MDRIGTVFSALITAEMILNSQVLYHQDARFVLSQLSTLNCPQLENNTELSNIITATPKIHATTHCKQNQNTRPLYINYIQQSTPPKIKKCCSIHSNGVNKFRTTTTQSTEITSTTTTTTGIVASRIDETTMNQTTEASIAWK